ncbi:MAG: hypothetical protein NZ805_14900 [Armatimonadetes bacterium]|nr:hypothetical protein [Armatimonadota bacterium]MDW8028553.1 hypothetical protein [Armatimonadota bacterium]
MKSDRFVEFFATFSSSRLSSAPTKQRQLRKSYIGDWREEFITYADGEIRIYTTTILTRYRFRTLMHDPLYRLDVAGQTGGRIKLPHVSFYLGEK